MKSKFIVFEGITGAGKKTHINLLIERLRKQGIGLVTITFPNYETDVAKMTRRPDLDPFTQSLLFAADRSLHQERIKGLLERGISVIVDRYCYSNFAYQSVRGVPLEWLMEIEKNIVKPDLAILIDVPVDVSIGRVRQLKIENFTKKEILNRLEKQKENLESIRKVYLQIARTDKETKWYIIDGTQEIPVIQDQLWDIISKEFDIK